MINAKKVIDTLPPDFKYLSSRLIMLKGEYPMLKKQIIGKSCCGRPIYMLTAGNGAKKILLAAGFHGCEWLTVLSCLRFCEDTVCSGGGLLSEFEIYFIPCVNPDGTEIAINGKNGAGRYRDFVGGFRNLETWSANARGVDINHNFDAGWEILHKMERENGITLPAPTRYGGTHAESEPETAAIAELCRRKGFERAAALHSQGEEIFWQYGENDIEGAKLLAKKMCLAGGYKLVSNSGLASHGGFKDWFITQFKKPAFTIEIGKGKNPLPISEFENIYEKLYPLLLTFVKGE